MQRLLLILAVSATSFAFPLTAEAQRGGGHGGGGSGHASGGGHGGYGGYGHGGYGGYGYHHYGYGGYYPYGFYGGFYGAAYYGAPYYGVYPTAVVSPQIYVAPGYPALPPLDPALPFEGAQLPKNRTQIQVVLPDPEAVLLFDGSKTSSVGKVRMFAPPELEPGVNYSYKLTVSWGQGDKAFTDVRRVSVVGGQATLVDFTRPPAPEAIPLPTPVKE